MSNTDNESDHELVLWPVVSGELSTKNSDLIKVCSKYSMHSHYIQKKKSIKILIPIGGL